MRGNIFSFTLYYLGGGAGLVISFDTYPPRQQDVRHRELAVISGGSRISQRGGANSQDGAPTYYLDKFFPEDCMKMNEIGPREERASLAPVLDPPMVMKSSTLVLRRKGTDVLGLYSARSFLPFFPGL